MCQRDTKACVVARQHGCGQGRRLFGRDIDCVWERGVRASERERERASDGERERKREGSFVCRSGA